MINHPIKNSMQKQFTCEKVFHYTKFQTLIDYILPKGTILLNKFSKSYDPLEKDRLCLKTKFTENGIDYDIDSETENKISNDFRFLCFTKDRDQNPEAKHLMQGHLLPRMWAQYGDRNKGVCLVFDKNMILEKIKLKYPKSFSGDIIYNLESKEYSDMEMINGYTFKIEDILHRPELQELIFLSKFCNYRDEQEWRVVTYSDEEIDTYIDFGDSLLAIIFGSSITKELIETTFQKNDMEDFSRYQSLQLYQVKYDAPMFHVDGDSIIVYPENCSCFDLPIILPFELTGL